MVKIRLVQTVITLSLILLATQGCIVYQSTPVRLTEITESTSVVKMITADGEARRLNRIDLRQGEYFAVSGGREFPLDFTQVEYIYLKDVQKSKKKTTVSLVVTGVSLTMLTIIFINSFTVGSGL